MLVVFHNPRCSTSRQVVQALKNAEYEFKIIEYLQAPPSKAELISILQKAGLKASELVRKKEDLFKELSLKDASESEILDKMVTNPVLIERPVLIWPDHALLGRPLPAILDKIQKREL